MVAWLRPVLWNCPKVQKPNSKLSTPVGLGEGEGQHMVIDRKKIIRDLGGGLILRQATLEDTQALVDFNSHIHYDGEDGKLDERVGAWTRDLMELPHPTFQVSDFTVVEDTTSRAIVSTMNLISQNWTYAGIPVKVGRPELVGTAPEYRNRGLVRAQFEVIHQWSLEREEIIQAITGIPYYYRIFGYEMALSLGGGRAGFKPHIPKLKEAETEPYIIRPATEMDIQFISGLYEQSSSRYLVSCVWDDDLWRYELTGKSEKNVNRGELRIIETPEGEPVGFFAHPFFRWGSMMPATAYEVIQGISWSAVTPTVIRYLQSAGEQYPVDYGQDTFESFGFWLGSDHPVYQVLRDQLPRVRQPYAWYIRIADLKAFITHIAPALEGRLAGSTFAGHSGEVKISFYRSGLKMSFESGRLVQVEDWKPGPKAFSGNAVFPDLTFLKLVFGYRSLDELKFAFPDCITGSDGDHALLDILFPKQNSSVWPVS